VAWVNLPSADRPRLFVVVDTEEEFDWSAPFSRQHTSVGAMRHVGRAQRVFDRYGIKPTYVVDYCVAHQPEGYEPLQAIAKDDRCTIGAHLHPWVNPPFEETVNARNSFASNLPVPLEATKIGRLVGEIEANFGLRPRIYKAGRYGIGAETVAALGELGFQVDCSVNPTMDFSAVDGPSFAGFGPQPFWRHSTPGELLFLPCTVGFIGALGSGAGPALHDLASRPAFRTFRAVGLLARLGLANKVMLSPEGNTVGEMMALARRMVRAGVRTFSLTLHSPSLEPGHTPYVRSAADLETFLSSIDRFCEFFCHELNGEPSRPLDFRTELMERRQ
jgi:hypothetical protein